MADETTETRSEAAPSETTRPPAASPDTALAREIARRRTFAIISHPDAGKTTLTEKLLLYSGAIELAGAVKRKAQQRHASSDWLEMEQARGISVTSSVLQFDHQGLCFNLLDTPGHQDFSEDTYRVLTAVDSAVMVLDAAKGVEPQTVKLFEVCRRQGLPVLTFVNKLDLAGREPLDLLDEIERVLGMPAVPLNWPLGMGSTFQGVYDLRADRVLRFERVARGERETPMEVSGIDDEKLARLLPERLLAELREEVELLAAAGQDFDPAAYREGRQTPVFFGSALNNFGVGPFLAGLAELAPPPQPRPSDHGPVTPAQSGFSGFVFKVQANMDRQHRDSMAFLRVVSGRFETGMSVDHPRLGRKLRLPRAHRIFARERESTEEAFAGDVVGLVNPGLFAIGDTVTAGVDVRFPPLPHFPPEHFARLRPVSVDKHKAFQKGLRQIEEEGAIQVFYEVAAARREPILGAVGELQFDVVQSRLEQEYGVATQVHRLPHRGALWVLAPAAAQAQVQWPMRGVMQAQDSEGRLVALTESEWAADFLREKNPELELATSL
ncbi:MAG TPA: peptide chain release factor 3 [Thermoanaerobaculia bacterium]|nr:peptide chain release factor 3 [Thermoanaerobaculia bacterium]